MRTETGATPASAMSTEQQLGSIATMATKQDVPASAHRPKPTSTHYKVKLVSFDTQSKMLWIEHSLNSVNEPQASIPAVLSVVEKNHIKLLESYGKQRIAIWIGIRKGHVKGSYLTYLRKAVQRTK
jgi:hypothetical protein